MKVIRVRGYKSVKEFTKPQTNLRTVMLFTVCGKIIGEVLPSVPVQMAVIPQKRASAQHLSWLQAVTLH